MGLNADVFNREDLLVTGVGGGGAPSSISTRGSVGSGAALEPRSCSSEGRKLTYARAWRPPDPNKY